MADETDMRNTEFPRCPFCLTEDTVIVQTSVGEARCRNDDCKAQVFCFDDSDDSLYAQSHSEKMQIEKPEFIHDEYTVVSDGNSTYEIVTVYYNFKTGHWIYHLRDLDSKHQIKMELINLGIINTDFDVVDN